MRRTLALALVAAALCAPGALGQSQSVSLQPRMGYVYPAGGAQGTTVEALVGGQALRGVSGAYVTGGGVRVTEVRHLGRPTNLDRDVRTQAYARIVEVLAKRGADVPPGVVLAAQRRAAAITKDAKDAKKAGQDEGVKNTGARNAEEELLENPEKLSTRELEFLLPEFVRYSPKKQQNMQIADTVFLEIEIDRDAAPGAREMRLLTPLGLTNPMRFDVSSIGEVTEPGDYGVRAPAAAPAAPPVLLNGQIKPGEADCWRIEAKKGQRLVIQTEARALNPYLADAVPGWFQAVIALRDAKGKEVAYADDYRFDPDPVLMYRVPETGVYELEIRDALYRGRLDFVYRVSVAQGPFVESIFPLGAREGTPTVAAAEGWNLGAGGLTLDTSGPTETTIREASVSMGSLRSNEVAYAVDDLPDVNEAEPNGGRDEAQAVELPAAVNGRIGTAGDKDVYRFTGREGEEVAVEVFARRLGSPMDSLVRLVDSSGRVVASNDDAEDADGVLYRNPGLLTHHADSCLRAKLPASGAYYVEISDAEGHGGSSYGYRAQIRPPRPDFELAVTPSSINAIAATCAQLRVDALRKEGFDGDIEVSLRDAPEGFALQGGMIQAGCKSVRMTLTAPPRPGGEPVTLVIEGRAVIDGRTVSHPAIPCEDMMQAFLYRHLVPSQELAVAVIGRRTRVAPPSILADTPVRIEPGGSAEIGVELPLKPGLGDLEMELSDAPEGLSLGETAFAARGATLTLKADAQKAKPRLKGNLIVEMYTTRVFGQGGPGGGQKRRVSIGVLPAIPFEVVEGHGAGADTAPAPGK